MSKDEALKLALEALEGVLDDSPKVLDASISGGLYEVVQCRDAITAIKAALAAPVQKRPPNCGTGYCSCIECVMEPAPVQEEDLYDLAVKADNGGQP